MIGLLFLLPASDVVRVVLESDAFTKGILLIILGFSIMAWAVTYHKYRTYGKVEEANSRFLRHFRSGKPIHEMYNKCAQVAGSPLARMLVGGYGELEAFRNDQGGKGNPDLLRQNITTIMEMRSTDEVAQLRRHLVFLAIASSVCPFFGLLGTVWGIMDSFLAITAYGSSSIQVIAPGVAEALITTVAGLAAAIPAVIAYNYFVSRLRRIIEVIDTFSMEFTNTAVREVIG